MSDRSLIVAIVAVGVSLCGVILLSDDGAQINARIDALDAKIDAKIDALDAKIDARIDALDARIDALDAKIDDIRVFVAAKHGERISFTPGQSGGRPTWTIQRIDAAKGTLRQIGTLEVHGGPERRAVLRIERNEFTREWAHLGNTDTLDRARALTNMSLARAGAE